MRVALVIVAMLFCAPVFAQGVKLPSVTNSIGMQLIEIPAGTFTMGSPAGEKDRRAFRAQVAVTITNEAQVAVTITKPFKLGKYEVTQGDFKKVMGKEPRGDKADRDCPAADVTWYEATVFCQKLTAVEHKAGILKADEEYRLPTEAEWEYACRAGTTTAYSFGDDESKLGEYAWFIGNTDGEKYAHKVGLKKPNPWGLRDMHGNVNEWCSDWYGEELSGGTDPAGPEKGSRRVARGGSWRIIPGRCRSAYRSYIDPSYRDDGLGFRVARSRSAE